VKPVVESEHSHIHDDKVIGTVITTYLSFSVY